MNEPKKILIIRTDRMGDVILSTPVIKNLRDFYPNAHIAFMCRPYTQEILEGNPYLNEIIVYDKDKKHKGILTSIKFSLWLRKKSFDLALVLNPTSRNNLIVYFAEIPTRVGFNRKLGFLLNHKIEDKKYEGLKHEMEYTLDILREIGVVITDKKTYFPIKESCENKIDALLKELGLSGKNFIAIHPSASCPSKRWPQEYFIKLIKLFADKLKIKTVLIGSENEKRFSDKIAEDGDSIDLRGKLGICETGSLLKRAKLFISNDSGPVHIAASLNVPVVSIFGRNSPGLSPSRWMPLGENSFYIHKGYKCKECLAHNCQIDYMCLKAITPDEVFKISASLIEKIG